MASNIDVTVPIARHPSTEKERANWQAAHDEIVALQISVDNLASSIHEDLGNLQGDLLPLMDGIAAVGVSTQYAREDHVHPSDTTIAGTLLPLMDGIARVGTALNFSREDHAHPSDTSRYAASNPANYQSDTQVAISISASIANYIPLTQRGVANGVATLDQFGIIPGTQLPAVATGTLRYLGVWDPVTNQPPLASGGAGAGRGDYYVVYRNGTSVNIDGNTIWVAGDWIVDNTVAWQRVQISSGFGSMASQNATAVAITGGTATLASFGTTFAKWADETATLFGPSVTQLPLQTFEDPTGSYAGQLNTDGTLWWHKALLDIATIPTLTATTETITNWLDLGFVRFFTAGPGLAGPSVPVTELGYDDGLGNTAGRVEQDGTLSWGKTYFRSASIDNLALNQALPIGGTSIAPQSNLLPMYPYAEEDSVGNIGRIVSSRGSVIEPPRAAARMAVNRIRPGYMMSVTAPTNGGLPSVPATVGNTYASVWTMEADFDWVRLLFFNDRAEGYQIPSVTVAPAAQLGDQVHPTDADGNIIPGTQVTWNNNGQDLPHYAQNSGTTTSFTIPAGWVPPGYIGVHYQLFPSDWVNVRSLPRSDGGKFPLLFVYARLMGPRPRLVSIGGGGTGSATAPPGTMTGRYFNVATQAGDFTTNYGGFTGTPPVNAEAFVAPYAIQYMLRNGRGVTLMTVGDSIAHGTGGYLGAGWGQHAIMALSELTKVPIGFWNTWNGAAAADMFVNAKQIMPLVKPNACLVQCWSRNVPEAPNYNQATADTIFRDAMDTCIFVERYGGVPILMAGCPSQDTTADTDAPRISAITRGKIAERAGMVFMEWDSLIGTGQVPNRQQPGLSSGGLGIHPNDEGQALFTDAFVRKLRQMLEV